MSSLRVRAAAVWALVFLAGISSRAWCQQPSEVTIGFGVDTTNSDVRAIVRTVRDYFGLPGAGHVPTPLWTASEQRARPDYDLTARMVFQGFPATIAGVVSADPGDSEYVVKTLFAQADSNGRNIRPIALQRLYATRRPDGWELSGALSRLTRDWTTTEAKGIVYHAPPGWQLDRQKVERAGRFMDSASHALRMNRPARIDYYLTWSAEDMYRVLGLDYFVLPSGPGTGRGGKTFPHDGIVISGDTDLGEAYLHELTHAIIGAAYPDSLQNNLVNEGIATWLGGSRGRPYTEAVRVLVEYQRTNPQVQFLDLIAGNVRAGWGTDEADALYATGALIADVVYTQNGIWGLKKLLTTRPPNRSVEPVLREMLEIWPESMDAWWRNETGRALKRLEHRRGSAR